jgi:hypothetical protein
MPFRCKQVFSREEKCLLDHLSPFGTSCSPSFSPSEKALKNFKTPKINNMRKHRNK